MRRSIHKYVWYPKGQKRVLDLLVASCHVGLGIEPGCSSVLDLSILKNLILLVSQKSRILPMTS